MKRIIPVLLAAVLLLAVLAGCGSSIDTGTLDEILGTLDNIQNQVDDIAAAAVAVPAPAPAETAEPEAAEEPAEEAAEPEVPAEEPAERVSLNIAYMPNYAALWAITTAIDQGFLDEEGIDVTLYEFADGPTEIAAMESGSIDLSYIGNGAHRLAITGDVLIFLPQQLNTTDSVVVNTNSGIGELADLAGKNVGYASGTSSETSLRSALTKAGLAWEDINAYEMDASNMVTAMVSGTVDAVATWSPYTLQIINEVEGTEKIEFENGSMNIASWVVLPSYAQEHPDILLRFTRALLKAMDYGSQPENYPYVAQLVADQTATDYEINLYQTEDAAWFNTELLTAAIADGSLLEDYEIQQDNFIKNEVLTEDDRTDVNDYLLIDLLEDALNG